MNEFVAQDTAPATSPDFPPSTGVSLKPCYYQQLLAEHPAVGFLELHAENYLAPGGPARYYLQQLREHYPVTVHGVGLSIGGETLDLAHLERVARLVEWCQPVVFSEHLAWSTHSGQFFNDLLPLPYTAQTLARVCQHIEQIQERLKRPMLLENPSVYVQFSDNDYQETEFLAQIVARTGCSLLLDINNVEVACFNRRSDPYAYLDQFPLHAVRQIHLAGHATERDAAEPLKIDSHDRQVSDPVWQLYRYLLSKRGDVATLIEWDAELPAFNVLQQQAHYADRIRREVAGVGEDYANVV